MGTFRTRVLVVGLDLQELLIPIRELGYETLFSQDPERVVNLAAAFNPGVALISQDTAARFPEFPAMLERILDSPSIRVLPTASLSEFLAKDHIHGGRRAADSE